MRQKTLNITHTMNARNAEKSIMNDVEDLRHVRHALRTLDASIEQMMKQAEALRVSLQVVGTQMDNLINQAKK